MYILYLKTLECDWPGRAWFLRAASAKQKIICLAEISRVPVMNNIHVHYMAF